MPLMGKICQPAAARERLLRSLATGGRVYPCRFGTHTLPPLRRHWLTNWVIVDPAIAFLPRIIRKECMCRFCTYTLVVSMSRAEIDGQGPGVGQAGTLGAGKS
jgi:hypothetical protein